MQHKAVAPFDSIKHIYTQLVNIELKISDIQSNLSAHAYELEQLDSDTPTPYQTFPFHKQLKQYALSAAGSVGLATGVMFAGSALTGGALGVAFAGGMALKSFLISSPP
jgi:hypothetical protein